MKYFKTATNLIAALILALAMLFTCPLAVQAQFEEPCETDEECPLGQICTVSGNICIDDTGCELAIKHKKIRAKKLTKPRKVNLYISANDPDWNRLGSRDLGPLTAKRFSPDPHRNKKRMKIKVEIPAGLEPGMIPIRIDDCYGEVEIIE